MFHESARYAIVDLYGKSSNCVTIGFAELVALKQPLDMSFLRSVELVVAGSSWCRSGASLTLPE